MDFKTMTIDEMEARKGEIAGLIDTDDADLTALEEEVRAINEELETRKEAASKREEIRKAVAAGAGKVVSEVKQEVTKNMKTLDEVRASQEYIEAYANYIKTDDDKECRALLTELADVEGSSGPVPVPTILEGRIRTAWERNGLMNLVRKTYLKGIVRVGFELSADPAVIHEEGAKAPDEEELTLGIISLIPLSLKKWIEREAA